MWKVVLSLIIGLQSLSVAYAGEISMISGLYQSEKTKAGGNTVGTSTMGVGLRYAEPLDDVMHWFGQANLTLRSYSGSPSPDNSTSLALLGGVRYYFPAFSVSVTPFLSLYGGYKADNTASAGVSVREVETSGLFYYGSTGFRFNLDPNLFLDTEVQIFESALFATETETTTTTTAGVTTSTEVKRTRTDLYLASHGPAAVRVGVGFRF